ncbi:ArsR/SmtB family transcription factor [Myxococcus qinghaiensis]|uniref:ArsR/SmtB family transcription factor n=1 Tax=Myxococcus qinghaiensis TaxID=2906758 RepID=UPI0020A8222E|nr:metalloregulator ArsR/SmtB family transcription factor [Myxococcus qinghaiensis]MCP3166814.1 metalloregulator ArsR/SmtB family transcription factor [Myxococcus qinghaiensis]
MSPRSAHARLPTASGPSSTLDAVFFALADSTRRALLARLRGSEATAGSLATGFAMTRPAVSRHLRVLRQAEMVREERRGRERVYTLEPRRLQLISDWLEDYRVFWPARLHDLKDFVESMPDDPVPPQDPAPRAPRSPKRRPR